MKKVLLVAVCLALVLTLAFTLGALGKKPDKPEYVNYKVTFKEDVEDVAGEEIQLGVQGRFLCSSYAANIELKLGVKFEGDTDEDIDYDGPQYGLYLDLSKQRGKITMQFFFPDPDTGDKVQLNVYDGEVDKSYGDKEWLSSNFKIIFDSADAEILPTKRKRDPLWGPGSVNITVVCVLVSPVP